MLPELRISRGAEAQHPRIGADWSWCEAAVQRLRPRMVTHASQPTIRGLAAPLVATHSDLSEV